MRFLCLVLCLFATLVAAGPNPINWSDNTFTAGKPTTITWQPTTGGTVTLQLQWGSSPTPGSGITITSSISNSGSFTWTPPSNLASQPDFTIEIISDQDPGEINYSPRFTISGLSGSSATSSAASSTLVSSVSSSVASSSASSSSASSASSSISSSTDSSTSSASSPTSTPSSTSSTSGSSTTPTSSPSSSVTSTSVPNTKNAGMRLTVSGGMLAVVMGVMVVM